MKDMTKESQIREYFDFYQKKILPVVAEYAIQKKWGYHGLYSHTDAVVFRAIDYALELGKNPMPVMFAAACHDMAKPYDNYDEEHGAKALPFAQKVMNHFPKELSDTEKEKVLFAIKNHTTGRQTKDYISACLWDADRTRLAWERGYNEKYFNTEYAKKVASNDSMAYIKWQNKVLGRTNKNREAKQGISFKKGKTSLTWLMENLKAYLK